MANEREAYDAFKAAWPLERLRSMDLNGYCSVGNDNAYSYWLEFKTDSLGGIGGGSAFKFGIFKRKAAKAEPPSTGYMSDGTYAWVSKYGSTATDAFAAIKAGLIAVAEAAARGDLSSIEAVDLSTTLKWKTAFLYQDIERPIVFPVFILDAMRYLAFGDPAARRSMSECNAALIPRKPVGVAIFDVMLSEWTRWTTFQGSVTGLIASDGLEWKDTLVDSLVSGGRAVMWWSKRPSGKSLVANELVRLVGEKGGFDFYFTRNGVVSHRAHVIGIAFDRDYDRVKSGWVGAIDYCDDFADYADDKRSAAIAFLIDGMEKLDGSLKPSDFTYWNNFSAPTQDNLQPFVNVRGGSDERAELETVEAGRTALPAKNVIFYGPPGTGKTYFLRSVLFDRFTKVSAGKSRERWLIEQTDAMSWWKVVAAVLIAGGPNRVPTIADHEFVRAKIATTDQANPRAMIWSMLQQHTFTDCDAVKYSKRADPQLFRKGADSVWSVDAASVEDSVPEVATFVVQASAYRSDGQSESRNYDFITFHQSISYEDFIEGIKPVLSDDVSDHGIAYEIKEGIFKQACRRARIDPSNEYALFIDEINRGNIAGIFGELITLIEEDKRAGGASSLAAILPYSRELFSVPTNLYIIGTMNSADRSVEALDTALRRRFAFVEMAPEPERLSIVDGVDLRRLLEVVNLRIEALRDRDHRIGHAYFMGIGSLDALTAAFADRVIPLLKEYFYGDWSRIALVLGSGFASTSPARVPWPNGLEGQGESAETEVWTISSPKDWTAETFRSIYA
jgi:5-methylcytosine-specific restriction enzyme B